MSETQPQEVRRTAASVEWYELPILGEPPRLTPRARAIRVFCAGLLVFWAGAGTALWWLL